MAGDVLVSAIMPAYNSARYIKDAIDSIVSQSHPHWELIVVDDGSTDETAKILNEYRDQRIRVYILERNKGPGAARNYALSQCRGKYIAICDSDDISHPNRFEKQVQFLESNPDFGVVSSQLLYFVEGEPPRAVILYPENEGEIRSRFARGKMGIPHAAAMMHRELFARYGLYDERCRRSQDLEFFLRFYDQVRFAVLPEFLVLYRHETRGVAFSKWRETTQYARYARYLANAKRDGSSGTIPFYMFSRRLSNLISLYTVDLARFIHYWWLTSLRVPYRIT